MQISDTEENRSRCLCPGCPSYPKVCKGELLYCSVGKSKCDIKAAGCICDSCPIWLEYKLSSLYFCDKVDIGETGSGKIMMRKKGSGEDSEFYQTVSDIKNMAASGHSIVRSMGSLQKMPFSFDDLHFVPAQVFRIPLNKDEKVNAEVIIGPRSKKPLKLSSPILISGMSFGAVSKSVGIVICRTAAKMKIGFNSGEGGILEEEVAVAGKQMIGQYATGRFGVTEENLKKVAAVEIRFGQGGEDYFVFDYYWFCVRACCVLCLNKNSQ